MKTALSHTQVNEQFSTLFKFVLRIMVTVFKMYISFKYFKKDFKLKYLI